MNRDSCSSSCCYSHGQTGRLREIACTSSFVDSVYTTDSDLRGRIGHGISSDSGNLNDTRVDRCSIECAVLLTSFELRWSFRRVHTRTIEQMMRLTESLWTMVAHVSGTVDHGIVLSRCLLLGMAKIRRVTCGRSLLLQTVIVTG